jgi:AcrR family transcriptional regulator
MRRDAQRNRDAILSAARRLFGDRAEFSMAEVARAAGVGQGTLYRNFSDRGQLAAAVMASDVDRLERLASLHADDPDAFFVLTRALTEAMVRSDALAELARHDAAVGSALDAARERVRRFMARPLVAAKARAAVRRDLTVDDIFLLLWMVRGAGMLATDAAARVTVMDRAFTLALEGAANPVGHPAAAEERS